MPFPGLKILYLHPVTLSMAGETTYTFLNRDLSWLSFNHRVLMEAADPSVPLYNRIGFLSIFASNLDEFFRVRMPSIYAFTDIRAGKTPLRDEYPKDLVQQVQAMVSTQLEEFGQILAGQILPCLQKEQITLYYGDPVRPEHEETIREYFLSRVLSFLQPVLLQQQNQANIFLENNALYFIVEVDSPDLPGSRQYALLNIPSEKLPRFLELPPVGDRHFIIFMDDIIRENLGEVFPGFTIHGTWSIKLTRDAELNLQDEFSGDIAEKIEKQLEKRDAGDVTRLLFDKSMPQNVREFLQTYFKVEPVEMVEGGRYHNLKDLGDLPNPRPGSLTYEGWPPLPHPGFDNHRSVFQSIAEGEKLLHLPYHSYNYILRFFNEAAIDPQVKEIYVTLYRVAAESHIVNALISAARNGKKVVVFVELKARFDEANNLKWSKKMKTAGIKIINSIPGLKVHAKVALIRRKEGKEWQYYSLLATGNLNESTGRFYGDHVFFTTNPAMAGELEKLFVYLQARIQPVLYGKIPFHHLLVSQFNMIKRFQKLIDREIKHAKAGKPARIIIKVNNLQDRKMIEKLYEASRAGVKVDLLIRSICCLAPGVEGQSENIQVRRLVDRYLEHARVFVFENNGHPEYFLGSADWMSRNLHHRIEVVFPVYDTALCAEIRHILGLQLSDNSKSVFFTHRLENKRVAFMSNEAPQKAQSAIYKCISGNKFPVLSQK